MPARYAPPADATTANTTTTTNQPFRSHINIPTYKVLVLGNTGSGRTSLFTQYCNGAITTEPTSTDKINIGVKLVQTTVGNNNQHHVQQPDSTISTTTTTTQPPQYLPAAPRTLTSIHLYDTPALHFAAKADDADDAAKPATHKSISQNLIEQMLEHWQFNGVCVVVNCTDLTSFSAIAAYKLILQTYYQNNVELLPGILCATKADLTHEFAAIDISDSADRNSMRCGLLCSTDSNAPAELIGNIDQAFVHLINHWTSHQLRQRDVNASQVVYNMPLDTPVSQHRQLGQLRKTESMDVLLEENRRGTNGIESYQDEQAALLSQRQLLQVDESAEQHEITAQ